MILVTGSSGHIGNVLVRRLVEQGNSVRILSTNGKCPEYLSDLPLQIVAGDLRDPASIDLAVSGADYVFHLAGIISISSFRDKQLEEVNVEGTRKIVEACMRHGVKRLIYTSSIHAIPDYKDGRTITEESDFDGKDLFGAYAKTKAAATKVVLDAVEKGLDAVITFPSGVLGPHDHRGSEAGRMIADYAGNRLAFYIDGAYNFVDVRDVVEGLLLAWQKGRKGEGYVLAGEKMTLPEFFQILMDIDPGMKKPNIKVPVPLALGGAWMVESLSYLLRMKPFFTAYAIKVLQSNCNISSQKAQNELGYSYRPVRESIQDAHGWLKANGRF